MQISFLQHCIRSLVRSLPLCRVLRVVATPALHPSRLLNFIATDIMRCSDDGETETYLGVVASAIDAKKRKICGQQFGKEGCSPPVQ
jgi:hypothetical protein